MAIERDKLGDGIKVDDLVEFVPLEQRIVHCKPHESGGGESSSQKWMAAPVFGKNVMLYVYPDEKDALQIRITNVNLTREEEEHEEDGEDDQKEQAKKTERKEGEEDFTAIYAKEPKKGRSARRRMRRRSTSFEEIIYESPLYQGFGEHINKFKIEPRVNLLSSSGDLSADKHKFKPPMFGITMLGASHVSWGRKEKEKEREGGRKNSIPVSSHAIQSHSMINTRLTKQHIQSPL